MSMKGEGLLIKNQEYFLDKQVSTLRSAMAIYWLFRQVLQACKMNSISFSPQLALARFLLNRKQLCYQTINTYAIIPHSK